MRVLRFVPAAALIVAALTTASCREEQPTQQGDEAKLASMRAEIEAMASTSCGNAAECAVIGFGSKPCGGPWTYLVYSKSGADVVVLERKVDEYNRFEEALNKRYGKVSDCMAILPPRVGCVDGTCKKLDSEP